MKAAEQALLKLAQAGVLAVFGLLLPLSPLLCAVIAGEASYLRRYRATLRRCVTMYRTVAATDVFVRSVGRSLRARRGTVREPIVGTCVHCGNCCIRRSCVFLEIDAAQQSRCTIYGRPAWRLTSCGRYPIDAADIEVYACPSFRAVPIRVVR